MALDKLAATQRVKQAGKSLANVMDEIRAVNFEATQSGFVAALTDQELTDANAGITKAELTAALATFTALATWWDTKAASVFAIKR